MADLAVEFDDEPVRHVLGVAVDDMPPISRFDAHLPLRDGQAVSALDPEQVCPFEEGLNALRRVQQDLA